MGSHHLCAASTDEYVYDYYTVQNDLAVYDEDAYSPFPL